MTPPSYTAGQDFENQIRQTFKRIGFKDVDGGPSFTAGGHQIDVCGGWDDIYRCRPCTARIGVNLVGDSLVIRICVNSSHKSLLDSEAVIQDFCYRRKAVGCAACVRDTLSFGGEDIIVNAQNNRGFYIVFGGHSENDSFGAGFEMVAITALWRGEGSEYAG